MRREILRCHTCCVSRPRSRKHAHTFLSLLTMIDSTSIKQRSNSVCVARCTHRSSTSAHAHAHTYGDQFRDVLLVLPLRRFVLAQRCLSARTYADATRTGRGNLPTDRATSRNTSTTVALQRVTCAHCVTTHTLTCVSAPRGRLPGKHARYPATPSLVHTQCEGERQCNRHAHNLDVQQHDSQSGVEAIAHQRRRVRHRRAHRRQELLEQLEYADVVRETVAHNACRVRACKSPPTRPRTHAPSMTTMRAGTPMPRRAASSSTSHAPS
jgi:hypothetical protein